MQDAVIRKGNFETWPFSKLRYGNDEAVGFELPIDSVLPPEIATQIEECSVGRKTVCIAWTAPSFIVMEQLEPITEEEEKKEIELSGADWHGYISQEFDIIPTVDDYLSPLDDDSEEAWYAVLRDAATKKALEHFGPEDAPVFPLCVLDSSSSLQFWSSVLFSVRGVSSERAAANRREVISWCQTAFAPLITSIPLTIYPEDTDEIPRWLDV